MSNETWRDRFDKKWDTSYGKVIYGEKDAGFMTCDLGEQFTVDKELVKDFIQSEIDKALDEQKKQMLEKLELWSAYHLSEEKASMLLSDVLMEINNLK